MQNLKSKLPGGDAARMEDLEPSEEQQKLREAAIGFAQAIRSSGMLDRELRESMGSALHLEMSMIRRNVIQRRLGI